ncbi:MAG: hypothetical protein IPL31_04335 [Saprospiraceae bacterium]|nr:hypothetical protein [Saprospiraceae bacterium]
MKIIRPIIILFCIYYQNVSFAQCLIEGAKTCETSIPICNFDILTCRNTNLSNPTGCSPLCQDGGAPTNTSWWSFISKGPSDTLIFSVNKCATNAGIQFGIIAECDCNQRLYCNRACNKPSSEFIITANFQNGQLYYLWVDGCFPDSCEFTLKSKSTAKPILDSLSTIISSNGDTVDINYVCKFEVSDTNLVPYYHLWKVNNEAQESYHSNWLLYKFNLPGTYTICTKKIIGDKFSSCAETIEKCIQVVVIDTTTSNSFNDSLNLVLFYYSFRGKNWAKNTNWLIPGRPIRTWYGITVDSNNKVKSIELKDNGLDGIMYELNFNTLEVLSLQDRNIKGLIPTFSGCPNLKQLELSYCGLYDTIPEFNLEKISLLNFNGNHLIGSVPSFKGMPLITTFNAYHNDLNKFPSKFNYFPRQFNVSLNRLNNQIPIINCNYDSVVIDLSYNYTLSSSIPNLNIPYLKSLNLYNCDLTGSLPDFRENKLLEYLNLNENRLSGPIPNFIHSNNIQSLLISFNNFSGALSNFDSLNKLKYLDISRNNFSGNLKELSKLDSAIVINCSYNNVEDTIPNLSSLLKLKDLNLSKNKIYGPVDLNKLKNLQSVSLEYNEISSVQNVNVAKELSRLTIDYCKLSGILPELNLPKLTILGINNNNFYSPLPTLNNSPLLKTLNLSNNNYTFSDLFNYWNNKSPSFTYSPQKLFYIDTVINALAGDSLTINLNIDSSIQNNIYLWTNHTNSKWTPDASNNKNSNKYNFKNISQDDAGRYSVQVSNSNFSKLKLISNTISIKVCDRESDSLELVSLYNSTGGSNWNNKTNWLTPGIPISSWYGITLNQSGCIQSIDLSDNKLSGALPALNLNTLDTLILNNNDISGTIPEFKIPFIKYLGLRNNNLVGSLPLSRHDWMNIKGLDLGQNNLTGSVPPDLGDLCDLLELKLDKNKFTGNLPEELTKLQNLEIGRVDFNSNNIDTLKPKIIFFCPFGDSILFNNPSYDRFQSICNIKCDNLNWNDLQDSSWLIQILNQLQCVDTSCKILTADAGFVNVRGLKFIYTRESCCKDSACLDKTDEVTFYDCGGHIVEIASCTSGGGFCSTGGSISLETFHVLQYDPQWTCGQKINMPTVVKENERPKLIPLPIAKNIFNLSCFPVPVLDDLYCNINQNKIDELTLINCLGMKAQCNYVNNGGIIRLSIVDLPQGFYHLEVRSGLNRYIGKFIKG